MKKLWLLVALAASPTLAQDAPPAAAGPADEIVVTAIKGQWSVEGKRLRAAQAAFAAGHARYAPAARMTFQLYPKGGRSTDGVRLTLRSDDEVIDIPLGPDLRFELPQIDSDKWRLTANRTPAEMGVKLWILSPGTSEADRRVGDLRLYCRVAYALMQDHFNFLERGAFAAVGGCDTTRVAIFTGGARPLASAVVVRGDGVSRPLQMFHDTRYRMPLGDKDMPDDARVKLTYR